MKVHFQRRIFMQLSEATKFLEQAYQALNARFFQGTLPPVVITIQSSPRTYGHYTPWNSWAEGQEGYREINISAETLDRDISAILGTMVHEMVHHFNAVVSNQKDVSRGGTYHNKIFKQVAESTGAITVDYDPRIGFSITHPTDTLIAFIEEQGWTGISLKRQSFESSAIGTTGKPKGRSNGVRKYVCPVCRCSVRATKTVNIGCLDCGTVMELEEK